MPEPDNQPRIEIDSDWKEEARREKERLLQQESDAAGKKKAETDPAFVELLNVLAMQAQISLGGYQGPGGQSVPPDLDVARQQIAMLEALHRKTEGNLSDEERRGFADMLHALRMQYVETAKAAGGPGTSGPGTSGPGTSGPGGGPAGPGTPK